MRPRTGRPPVVAAVSQSRPVPRVECIEPHTAWRDGSVSHVRGRKGAAAHPCAGMPYDARVEVCASADMHVSAAKPAHVHTRRAAARAPGQRRGRKQGHHGGAQQARRADPPCKHPTHRSYPFFRQPRSARRRTGARLSKGPGRNLLSAARSEKKKMAVARATSLIALRVSHATGILRPAGPQEIPAKRVSCFGRGVPRCAERIKKAPGNAVSQGGEGHDAFPGAIGRSPTAAALDRAAAPVRSG